MFILKIASFKLRLLVVLPLGLVLVELKLLNTMPRGEGMRYEIFSKKDFEIPEIEYMGYSADSKVTRFGATVRESQYILHFVISGKGYFNGTQVNAGQGFVIPMNTLAEYHPDEADPWSFLWVVSLDARMLSVFEMLGADEKTGVFNYKSVETVAYIGSKFMPYERRISSSALLCEYFLHILNAETAEKETSKGIIKDYFEFSEKYIENNLHSELTVAGLCDLLGITQPYLFKIFKARSGISPKQYIDMCRIKKSKQLLKTTSLTVSQIGASVGFADVLAFSKFFSKNVGTSPSAYRIEKRG